MGAAMAAPPPPTTTDHHPLPHHVLVLLVGWGSRHRLYIFKYICYINFNGTFTGSILVCFSIIINLSFRVLWDWLSAYNLTQTPITIELGNSINPILICFLIFTNLKLVFVFFSMIMNSNFLRVIKGFVRLLSLGFHEIN